MLEIKQEIKRITSSKTELVFVKVPDALTDISVDNNDNVIIGKLSNEIWTSKKIPKNSFVFNGYSHELTEEKIKELFSSRNEFYQICNRYEILYNYSAYTGKWIVLSISVDIPSDAVKLGKQFFLANINNSL